MQLRSWRRGAARAAAFAVIATLALAATVEIRTSWLESELLSGLAGELGFRLGAGPSPSPGVAAGGPYDARLGYAGLPALTRRLGERGFAITQQARLSDRHVELIERGVFPIYREKTRAGLTLLDRSGAELFAARFPGQIYPDLEAVPPLVLDTLLFIENRELLDDAFVRRNPAIEWDRLALVVPRALLHLVRPSVRAPGASTLATQIEKYRHSPAGRTDHVLGKLQQIASASLRGYLDGPDTTAARRQIAVDYLNSTPLSARAGLGEINGLGDGLAAWFGADFARTNELLAMTATSPAELAAAARAYREVLALLLAQRRPSYYLLAGREELGRLIDRHLGLLMTEGIVGPELGRAALEQTLEFRAERAPPDSGGFVGQKAATAIRSNLLELLGLPGFYQLDRLDLEVATTLDLPAQQRVTQLLEGLRDPAVVRELGLYGFHLLDADASAAPLIVSLTLFERGAGVNYLRLQADNLDQPFDLNQGAKLDLGSTAKLRTLITYLEIIAGLHDRLRARPEAELRALAAGGPDPLTRWAAGYLATRADPGLAGLLEAAMARTYPANPAERFFTAGGSHRFANFDAADNDRIMTVANALRHSVNLVFIRLMRDIVRYEEAAGGVPVEALLSDPLHPLRAAYLVRFADREGRTFLNGFYDQLAGHSADDVLARLAQRAGPRPERLSALFRSLRPGADPAALQAFLGQRLPGRTFDLRQVERLYDAYPVERLSLNDRAYLAGLHPLELWLAAYWQDHPLAGRAAVLEASAAVRQESYAWLFKTNRKQAQDRRIRVLLEEDAFTRIHQAWQRLGYPFERLVPSYATAIGSSADRPEALADLVGIVLNEGVWQPTVRIAQLHFAAGTPFETVLGPQPKPALRVLAPEIAAVVRQAMIDVVENGTATRLRGAYVSASGAPLLIGAKTGTGDHRRKSFARGGRLIESAVVSRTATVVFFIGDEFFGNLTVYVPGPQAAGFKFTSSLPAQLLKAMAPALQPLLDGQSLRTAEAPPTGGA